MRLLPALDRKLLRDLLRLRGQVFAIALIIASGVGVFVMSLVSINSLSESADAYYQHYRFADIFAHAKRAPLQLVDRIATIPGVQLAEPRIVKLATLDVADFNEPIIASLVSMPQQQSQLNRLALRKGRYLDSTRPAEVIVNEPFAEAHRLEPGDHITALINGRKRRLDIVGVALSPEFVYAIGPGALMPDDQRFGVLWMNYEALAGAFDLKEAFNDISLSLWHGAKPALVVHALDDLLEPFGGFGAVERKNQISNWFLMNEIEQLRQMATLLPMIFFIVAAFLTNLVLARLIALERSEIGLLKAFGYSNSAVVWHYAKFVLLVTAGGIVMGWLIGYWMGRWSTVMYTDFFRFPKLYMVLSPQVFLQSAAISFTVSLLGALGAARQAARLAPAEAMRPPAPPNFRRARVSARLAHVLDQPTRILLRSLARAPIRSSLTAVGVATATGVLVMALQWLDAIDFMMQDYFFAQQRQDLVISLHEPANNVVANDVLHLPGVLAVEPRRAVAARFHHGHLERRETVSGLAPHSTLEVLRDTDGNKVSVPREGLLMSSMLAKLLQISEGDEVTVEILEGRKPVRRLPVVKIFDTLIGAPAYMDQGALNRLMREPPATNMLYARLDAAEQDLLFRRLKDTPAVSAITVKQSAVQTFYDTMGETMYIYVSFFVAFGCMLAFGVIYNNMRIALSERGRELATLRVLGFRVGEISYMLIGEAALLVFLALLPGCVLGWLLSKMMVTAFETELYRVPMVVEQTTYGVAVLISLITAIATAALVRRRLGKLDLIAVLKTRE